MQHQRDAFDPSTVHQSLLNYTRIDLNITAMGLMERSGAKVGTRYNRLSTTMSIT